MNGSEPLSNPVPDNAVVVAVDGSDAAERAVDWAARYAVVGGHPLVIAHAVALIAPEAAGMTFEAGFSFTRVDEQLKTLGEDLVASARDRVALQHPSLAISAVAEHDDPRQMLLRLAEKASLVVMGSRGRGAFGSLLLGSVTTGVAGRAKCPVVVIPATES